MTDELNQVQETIDDPEVQDDEISKFLYEGEIDDSFDDEEVIEDKPVEDEPEADDEVEDDKDENQLDQEETQKTEQDQDFLTVKFNKADVKVSKDEAVTLVQKGMNYDRVIEKVGKFEPTFNEISRLAATNGMTIEQYLGELNKAQESLVFDTEMETLKQEFPDADEKILQELAKTRIGQKALKEPAKQEPRKQEDEQVEARKKEIGRQIDIFKKRYPNIDPQKLDKEVYSLMKDGYTLLEAYESNKNDKLLAQQKQNDFKEKNRRRSLGNLSNNEALKDDISSILFAED